MTTARVVFSGKDAANKVNLWVTDGTSAGTSELTVTGVSSGGLFSSGVPDFTILGGTALFAGVDSNNRVNFWETNGTVSGTAELTIPGQYAFGLQPRDFTPFGSRVLFAGYDASGDLNLWITDGTAAGTSELNVAGASASGVIYSFYGPDFAVLGNKALFTGYDTSNHLNLWVTDGTAAGTSEIQVAGAYSGGLLNFGDPDFTVLGNKVLFAGYNANGRKGLWVTDGTTQGTSELISSSAYGSGFFYTSVSPDFTPVANGRMVFEGYDALGHLNLWVTDGTSAGTSELTAFGADPNGLFYFERLSGSSPNFTSFGGKVIFEGEDVNTKFNLWITDGTSAGTNEFSVASANAHGLFYNGTIQAIPDFTVLGNKVLFAGFDANGHSNLWVTDGTSAGTIELIVAGADPSGLFYNNGPVQNPNFTVIGNRVLFSGFDLSGHVNLWVTDGTAAGTSQLTAAGANTAGLNPANFFVFTNPSPAPSDVNGDGASDILFQNNNGQVVAWELNGFAVIGSGSVGNPGLGWHVRGTGDFNGDGISDILWQNANGAVAVWGLSGTSVIGAGVLGNPGPSWHVIGAGDYNRDGRSDILWQNASGEVAVWAVNGLSVIGGGSVGNPGPSWHAIAAGDFNADGFADILWQNDSGEAAVWELNALSVIGGGSLGNPGPSWHAIATGDVNGDGRSDIVWQNDSGAVAVWALNGASVVGSAVLGNPGPSWHVLAAGDYNGDGLADIQFQNSSGEVAIWELNGGSVIGTGGLGNPGPSWHAQGLPPSWPPAGDFNGDGYSDILFQNTSGAAVVWAVAGTAVVGSGGLGNPGPSWRAVGSGDFDGDGHGDVLWQNTGGDVVVWELNGAAVTASGGLGNPGAAWRAIGTGDFNADGHSDILFQNTGGDVAVWDLNGPAMIGAAGFGNPGASWHAIGAGDFNADGNADILFQNTSGEVFIWETNGQSVIGGGSLGNPGPSWHAIGTGDFNGDGRSDILFQNDSGELYAWQINGAGITGGGSLGNPGAAWHALGTGDYNGDGRADIRFQNNSGEVALWELSGTSIIAAGSLGNPGTSWHVV